MALFVSVGTQCSTALLLVMVSFQSSVQLTEIVHTQHQYHYCRC